MSSPRVCADKMPRLRRASRWMRLPRCLAIMTVVAIATLARVARSETPALAEDTAVSGSLAEPGLAQQRCSACFRDLDGRTRDFGRVYDAWFALRRRDPHYLLAAGEMAATLALGTTYYWIRPSINQEDWDFPDPATRLGNLQGSFDNNRFQTNFILHPMAGASYYLFARECDLSPPVAALYSVGSSAVFEFLLEWLEKVSVNDLIFTPGAGIPTGEFVFQLAEYLNSAPSREQDTPQTVARYTLGSPSALHGRSARETVTESMPPDRLGLSSAYWHRFGIAHGLGLVQNDRGDSEVYQRVTMDAEIVSVPGFLRPGRFALSFGNANFNEFRFRYAFGSRGIVEADSRFTSILFGYYAQGYRATRSGLHGSAALVGYGMGYRYRDSQPLGRRDQYALVHVFGPESTLWLAGYDLLAKLRADVHLDFGGVYSLPYERYARQFGSEGTKSILQNHGYYYVHGGSGRIELSLSYHGVELGARQGYGYYQSIEGDDRFQSQTTSDIPSNDDIVEFDAWLRGRHRSSPLEVRVDYNALRRRSQMPPLVERRSDRRVTLSLGVGF